MRKMTDGDVMVYIRNQMLALSDMAKQYGVDISISANADGFANAKIGDYDVTQFKKGNIKYAYMPLDEDTEIWQNDIKTYCVNFSGNPYMEWGDVG